MEKEKLKKRAKIFAPILSAVLVITCVGESLASYTPVVYEVQAMPEIEEEETDDVIALEEAAAIVNLDLEEEEEIVIEVKTGLGSTTIATVAETSAYQDGTYYGSGTGFEGTIGVKVVIKNGEIASISITQSEDDEPYFSSAKAVISSILSKQSTNVDTVSGATYSSVGIISAVRNALAKAAVDGTVEEEEAEEAEEEVEETEEAEEAAEEMEDAVAYEITATCEPDENQQFDAYDMTLRFLVAKGKIIAITFVDYVCSGTWRASNTRYIDNAISGIAAQLMALESATDMPETIDTVSRATCSSKAIINAYQQLVAQLQEEAALAEEEEADAEAETDEAADAEAETETDEEEQPEAAEEETP